MEQTPYTNFWKEEPENQRKAWRPTDESRRRLQMFGLIQFLLLGAIVVLGMMIAKETKRVPRIFAQLPDGLVFETTESHPYIPRVARMELVNNTLALLYYQEGANSYLGYLTNNVKKTILTDVVRGMALSKQKTNSTVHLTIDETFETSSSPSAFEAMTKGTLIRRERAASKQAPIYLRTRWIFADNHYVLTGIMESTPGDYNELFNIEKARLQNLTPEQLKRELNIRRNEDIPLPEQNTGKL
jgi:hypothetical protein